ncbi:hypothetical protein GS891_11460 [Rhodococcus hoagii]|nr:hypothetical protein [Prescottella equi]
MRRQWDGQQPFGGRAQDSLRPSMAPAPTYPKITDRHAADAGQLLDPTHAQPGSTQLLDVVSDGFRIDEE